MLTPLNCVSSRLNRRNASRKVRCYSSTIWVCVTMATSLPSSRERRVCQTELRRPTCSGVVSASTVVPSFAEPMKFVLLSMVVVQRAVWQIEECADRAERIRKRHDGAAMHDVRGGTNLRLHDNAAADQCFGCLNDLHAHQPWKWLLRQCLAQIHRAPFKWTSFRPILQSDVESKTPRFRQHPVARAHGTTASGCARLLAETVESGGENSLCGGSGGRLFLRSRSCNAGSSRKAS